MHPETPRPSASAPRSAMAIAGLVLGVVALLTSFVPIVNNLSFVLGGLGVVFAVVGLVATVRGTRSGKGLAIAALAVGVASVAVVLATQSLYGAALDAASDAIDQQLEGPAVAGTTTQDGSVPAEGAQSDLAVGTAVNLENGLSVSVDSVQTGIPSYGEDTVVGVQVTYTNGGSEEVSFNVFDWEGQDAQGVQRNTTLFGGEGAVEPLGSGKLAPGGTVTGMLCFDEGLAKILYSASLFGDTTASWNVA